MDGRAQRAASGLVDERYVRQGFEGGLGVRRASTVALLSSRRLPERGWGEAQIEALLLDLAAMDSNNFPDNVGLGEREARVVSPLVRRRHFGLGHGVGRSGDIGADQPKAAGSSLLYKLTNVLARDALRVAGLDDVGPTLVLPLATGMTLALALAALRDAHAARHGGRPAAAAAAAAPDGRPLAVVWPRIDQKSCIKSVGLAGLRLEVVENVLEGDQLRTDVEGVRAAIARAGGPAAVACVLTTTSCFAPRAVDRVVDVARLCAELGVPHLVNNAYGVQSRRCMADLTAAMRKGRVDAVVQSTDKNFLVPVGGAVIAAPKPPKRPQAGRAAASSRDVVALVDVVGAVNAAYPGRASADPILDVFVTLLGLGRQGWEALLAEREALVPHLKAVLADVALRHGERVLDTPDNPISMGMTLRTLLPAAGSDDATAAATPVTALGSMLFTRCCSGPRAVPVDECRTVEGHVFRGWMAHAADYPHPYLAAACALGVTRQEIDTFAERLDRALKDARQRTPPPGMTPDTPPA